MMFLSLFPQNDVSILHPKICAQVVVSRFPNLHPAIDTLLDIYFMLSAGRHHLTSDLSDLEEDGQGEGSEQSTAGKFLSLTGRLISTR